MDRGHMECRLGAPQQHKPPFDYAVMAHVRAGIATGTGPSPSPRGTCRPVPSASWLYARWGPAAPTPVIQQEAAIGQRSRCSIAPRSSGSDSGPACSSADDAAYVLRPAGREELDLDERCEPLRCPWKVSLFCMATRESQLVVKGHA